MFLKFKKLKVLKNVFSKFKRIKNKRFNDSVDVRPELTLRKTFFFHLLTIIVFDVIGTVTQINCCNGPAPSILDAS